MFCEADVPYNFCYFEINGKKYFYTLGHHERFTELFEWKNTETKCGMSVMMASRDHEGDWKCHLANTDQKGEEDIVREAIMNVLVASPANIEVSVDKDIKNIPQGEAVSVECIIHEEGHPPAEIVLNHEKHARSMDELGDGSAVEVRVDHGIFQNRKVDHKPRERE